jgi:hypothetical protein
MAEAAFKFPDEQEKPKAEAKEAEDIQVEVVDDTPPEDRGREPLPKELVKELEEDDLEEYSDKVKKRLSQMKKVWHDERREKEAAVREREEAIRFAQAKDSEIKQLRGKIGAGEKQITEEMIKSSEMEIANAKKLLQKAYEEGDSALIADAQEALTDAKIRYKEAQYRRPTLQEDNFSVQNAQQTQEPSRIVDPKAEEWRTKNTWFGADEEMTSLALGLHEKLVRSGVDPRSDDYYRRVDETMRKRFPEYFDGETTEEKEEPAQPREEAKAKPRKSATVVAPATRSTAPNKVRLTQTQLALAKKFRLTPEQYAKELLKLENNNG